MFENAYADHIGNELSMINKKNLKSLNVLKFNSFVSLNVFALNFKKSLTLTLQVKNKT